MKPLHLPITGHDLLAVERFQDSTRHMIEFLVLADCPLGNRGSTSGAFSPRTATGRPLPMRGRAASKSVNTPASLRGTSCLTSRKNGAKTDRR